MARWILLALLCAFGICAYLTWERRAPWHVVATLPGMLPPYESTIPYVLHVQEGTITFPDTLTSVRMPEKYRLVFSVEEFPTRAAFRMGPDRARSVWNLEKGREVPVPFEEWRFSAGGTQILAIDPEKRRVQILDLDGAVLRDRTLPSDPRQVRRHAFSPGGAFVMETYLEEGSRVFETASDRNWSFPDQVLNVSDDGVAWLRDDRGLRAVRLENGQDRWRTELDVGEQVVDLGRDLLAVDLYDKVALLDARNGRKLLEVAGVWPDLLRIRSAGPKAYLVGGPAAVEVETGRPAPFKGPTPWISFFEDGRRALIDAECGWPARVVEIETGHELFSFPERRGARLAGNRVLTSAHAGTVDVWERRHPEGWKGQVLRPEVLGLGFLGVAILALFSVRPR